MKNQKRVYLFLLLIISFVLPVTQNVFGYTMDYEYDNQYRLTKVARSDGTVIQYYYDAAGNRTRKIVTGSTTTVLNAPTLNAPANNALNQPENITLFWTDTNSNPQEQGFTLRIRPNSGTYTEYSAAQDATSITLQLQPSTTYFWSVKANGNGSMTLDSPWSEDRYFTTVAPGTCSFTFNPTSPPPFSAAGGLGSIQLTASEGTCPWTVLSNDPWIVITSEENSTGNGTISYLITPHFGNTPRTGTIVIGGQNITISQMASGYCAITVTKSGTGMGTVTGQGINCGSDCTETFTCGASVTLTANAAPGSSFAGWSGGLCTGTGDCTVTVDDNVIVSPVFNSSSGTLWSWGYNSNGQLGDGTLMSRPTPDQITALGSINVAIVTGWYYSINLKSDGTVWTWGSNAYGQLGDGTSMDRPTAAQVSGLENIVKVAGGAEHSLALKSDGTVWAWGHNYRGQLGDGTIIDRPIPVQAIDLNNIIAVAAGTVHSMALKSDGKVWAWGRNRYGQLGDGTTTDRPTPLQIASLNNVTAIAGCGGYSLALKSDGTVWAWGENSYGQLGDGTTDQRLTPVPVSGLNNVVAISCGGEHTVALKSDGTVWTWGSNGGGELGDGTTTQRSLPGQVPSLNNIAAIAAGGQHTMALKSDKTAWAWGWNGYGQLGDGTTTDRSTPVQISGLTNVVAIAGSYHTLAIKLEEPATTFTLSLNKSGSGSGTVISNPAGINCGTDCTETYASGIVVTLTATADPNSYFLGWSGGGCNQGESCTISITSDVTVSAFFNELLPPYVTVHAWYDDVASESGPDTAYFTVGRDSPNISRDLTVYFTLGGTAINGVDYVSITSPVTIPAGSSSVNVFVTPIIDSLVEGPETVTLTLESHSSYYVDYPNIATITIEDDDQPLLTVVRTGTGSGTITADGLSCSGNTCSGLYTFGALINIEAATHPGSTFEGWSGCDSVNGNICSVTMSAEKFVTAVFNYNESLSLYDDFNTTLGIDLTKWQGEDVAREVTNGQLRMKARSYYNSTQPVHIDLSLANPDSIQTIESKVTLGTYQNTQQSNTMVALFGRFFNDGTGAGVPGSNLGDIMAFVSIGGTSETPSFSWSVGRFTDPTNGNLVQTIDMGTFTTVPVVGTPSTLSISWDGATFTFTADGEIRTTSPALSVYPANMPQRGFFVRQSNNTGKEALAEVFFDDVKVNGADYDDFGGALVDQTKWVTYEHVREVTNGALRMRNRTAPNSLQSVITNSLNFAYPTEINAMQTTVTPTSFSNPSGATNKARIGGRFFNDGTGTPGNHLGEYVVDVFIGGTGATPVGSWSVIRHTNATNINDIEVIASGNFATPVVLGSPHTLYLAWDGSSFTFRFNGEETFYTPTSSINPSNMPLKFIGNRIASATARDASIEALFDDVMTSFVVPGHQALFVQKTGTGTGLVSSEPSAINCGSTCVYQFTEGAQITLTAVADSGSTFYGWSGCDSVNGNTCSVTMTASKMVMASFSSVPLTGIFWDDFNDNIIDGTKWVASGNRVVEEGGVIKVEVTVTDGGGGLTSFPIAVNLVNPIVIYKRTNVSYANEYFGGGMTVTPTEAPEKAFRITYGHMAFSGTIPGNPNPFCAYNGFFINRNGTTMDYCYMWADGSEGTNPIWGTWFDERFVYHPATGQLEYFMNEEKRIDYNVGALPNVVSHITLSFNAWGWYTGHYQYLDAISVNQEPDTNQYVLSLQRTGTGTGTVVGTGISCGSDCSETYASGTVVVLTATPDAGSSLTSWSGCDSFDGDTCTVTMTGNKSVFATFNLDNPNFNLDAYVSDNGTGTITSNPAGISCGSDCSETYASGTTVTLTATPNEGYSFSSWYGCDTVNGNTCTVTMNNYKYVVAYFNLNYYSISASYTGTGTGTINDPWGSYCYGTCGYYSYGTDITITATPGTNSVFTSWTGCDSVDGNVCLVTITTNRSVTATFTRPLYTLTAIKTGTGSGTISGLTCSGDTCTGSYQSGQVVSLNPVADPGSTFAGWTSCDIVNGNTCRVTMSANKSVTATFTLGGPLDTAFNPDTEGEVHAIAFQPDGKVIIGGYFYAIRGAVRRSVARLNPDGTLDIHWKPDLENWDDEQSVMSIAIQGDVEVLIGGYFFGVDGLLRTSIARLNTDGSLDMDFEPDVGGYTYDELGSVMSVVLQPDGKILMGGYFGSINGVTRQGIARLNPDSTLDMDFNPNASNEAYITSIVLQPDGKILIGGDFTTMNGTARNGLARLNADGTLDTAFNPLLMNGSNPADITVVALQPDGKILIGGSFTTVNGVTRNRFARLNSNGTLDTDFNVSLEHSYYEWDGSKNTGPASPYSIALQANGKILVGGYISAVNGVTRNGLARLYPDGSLDPDFDPNVTTSYSSGTVYSIALQADGNILIGGDFTAVGGVPRYSFARIINTDNPPADTYTLSINKTGTGSGTVTSTPTGISCGTDCSETYASGTVVVLTATADAGSTFTGWSGCPSVNENTCTVTMDANKSVFATFDSSTYYDVSATTAGTGSGTISAPGLSCADNTCSGTFLRNTVISITASASPGSAFSGWSGCDYYYLGADNTCYVTMTGNKSVTATFTLMAYTLTAIKTGTGSGTISGLTCSGDTCTGSYQSGQVVSLNPVADPGSTFAGWTSCDIVNGNTCRVTMSANKSVTATFTLGGPLDTAFNPDTEGEVHAIAFQPDGKVIIGGYFYAIRGAVRRSVARLNPDGTLDIHWKPDLENWDDEQSVMSIAIQGDVEVLIGGYFFGVDGLLRTSIARLNTDGSLDMDFEPDVGGYTYDELGSVMSVVLQPDGKILMGGYFGSINGVTRQGIARLNPDSTLDMDFNPNASNEASITSIVLQPDGKILIGGDFTTMNGTARNGLARLNADGTLDTAFNPLLMNGSNPADITVVALQPDGKILIGGSFTTVNGVTRNRFARLNSNGTLDTDFNVSLEHSYYEWDGSKNTGPASPYSIALQANGKILVGGYISAVNGVTRNGLARLYPDGSLDPDFDPNVTTSYSSGTVYSIALQADGNILIGGDFTAVGGVPRYSFARIINTDNPPADTYTLSINKTGTGSGTVTSTPTGISCGTDCSETYASGTVVVLTATADAGSTFTGWSGCPSVNENTCTVTMDANKSVFATFDSSTYYDVSATTAGTGSGTISAPGLSCADNTCSGTFLRNTVISITASASPGSAFSGWSGCDYYYLGADNTCYVTMTGNKSVTATFTLMAYTLTAIKTGTGSGTISGLTCSGDTCTGSYQSGQVVSLNPVADPGSTFAGWTSCDIVNGNTCRVTMSANKSVTATFTLGGPLDTAFNPDTEGEVHAIAFQPDGKVIIGGYFYAIRGAVRRSVARLNPDGTLDIHWKPDLENWDDEQSVMSIAIQGDVEVLIGGYFFGVDGLLRTSIARLNTDGSLDMDFEPDVGGYTYDELGSVMSVVLQPDGKILMGGYFGSINGVTRQGIARLNPDSTLDMDFNPNASNEASITSIVLQPDGKILIGGDFTTMNGTARNGLARLNADGTLDTAFNPLLMNGSNPADITVVALQPDGKILIGGSFTTVNGVTRNRFARLNSNGTLDTDFNVSLEHSYYEWDGSKITGPASPYSIALQANGKILVGGYISAVNGVTQERACPALP